MKAADLRDFDGGLKVEREGRTFPKYNYEEQEMYPSFTETKICV